MSSENACGDSLEKPFYQLETIFALILSVPFMFNYSLDDNFWVTNDV